ncbi:MAG: PepSY domain-containing protein [Anaerolineae bacterium]|nr:PepSY domain-containing protein [Anaerolineae bacterium]
MKINRWIALAGIALLVVAAMGAMAFNAYAQAPTQDGDDTSESQDNGAALQGQAAITQEEAEAIALAGYPGAKVLAAELENEGGTLLYSIELDNSMEVEVDANNGTVLPAEAETGAESGG